MKNSPSTLFLILGPTFLVATEFFASNGMNAGGDVSLKPIVSMPSSATTSGSFVTLKVIPERATESRLVLRLNTDDVIVKGRSNIDLLCGECKAVLAEGVAAEQLSNVVLYCNHCGSFNDTEANSP